MSPAKRPSLKSKLQSILLGKKNQPSVAQPEASFLEAESLLGAQIFGPAPEEADRRFFHSTKKNVWIWHENGVTVRYEVHPQGVYKRIGADPFVKLEGRELKNFRSATQHYLTAVKTHLYNHSTQPHHQ